MKTTIAVDPALDASSSADLNQLLLPNPDLGGPGLPRPAYPSQINDDLEPLTQDPHWVSAGHHQPELNPSVNSHPEPWNQQFVNGGSSQHHISRPYSGVWPPRNYSVPRPQHWFYSTSEMDCSVSGRIHPDSAYYTKSPASQSIFSGEFPASSQQSLTGAMNAMPFANEQMYGPYATERPTRGSQEIQHAYAEQPYAEHQAEHVAEWVCEDCETPQNFKNKSEYKYVQAAKLQLRLSMTDRVQQTQTSP